MIDSFTVRQAIEAADVTRTQLEQWVSRKFIVPENTPAPGEARSYTLRDIRAIATLAELSRLTSEISIKDTSSFVLQFILKHLTTYRDGRTVLAIWQGSVEILSSTPRGTPAPKLEGKGLRFYDPDQPPFSWDIVRPDEIPALIVDPDKRSMVLVNLSHVEQRILQSLGVDREGRPIGRRAADEE